MIGVTSEDKRKNAMERSVAGEPQDSSIIQSHHDIIYEYCVKPEIEEEKSEGYITPKGDKSDFHEISVQP